MVLAKIPVLPRPEGFLAGDRGPEKDDGRQSGPKSDEPARGDIPSSRGSSFARSEQGARRKDHDRDEGNLPRSGSRRDGTKKSRSSWAEKKNGQGVRGRGVIGGVAVERPLDKEKRGGSKRMASGENRPSVPGELCDRTGIPQEIRSTSWEK